MMTLLQWLVMLILATAQLSSGGSITGIVRTPGGTPANTVRVVAMAAPGVGVTTNEPAVFVSITQTDTIPLSDGAYFRMAVKDELTSAITPWAYVENVRLVPKIIVGETLTVPGTVSTDRTNRLSAFPF